MTQSPREPVSQEAELLQALARHAPGNVEVQRRLADLERIIAARDRAEGALRVASARLARSNAELQRFASTVAHDLQEPLKSVEGHLDLLSRRPLDASAQADVQFASDEVQWMRRLVADLLQYARVDSRPPAFGPVEASDALDQALQNLSALIGESLGEVTRDPLPVVKADFSHLVLLFQNLVSNGLKFRGAANPWVHVGARQAGGEWEFSVRDNGAGIDPERAGGIFGPSRRLRDPSRYSGTGVGLAICKKIVEMHGGRIRMESEPGKGSVFHFSIPSAEDDA